jgi:hypothetical protein
MIIAHGSVPISVMIEAQIYVLFIHGVDPTEVISVAMKCGTSNRRCVPLLCRKVFGRWQKSSIGLEFAAADIAVLILDSTE